MAGGLVLLSIAAMVFATYRNFEPPEQSGKTVPAQITGYTRGANRANISPHFIAKLQNDFIVHVRDDGEVPSHFRGAALLDLSKGENTGVPMYTFSKSTISKIHNKAKQARTR